jgi:hypothetical protein
MTSVTNFLSTLPFFRQQRHLPVLWFVELINDQARLRSANGLWTGIAFPRAVTFSIRIEFSIHAERATPASTMHPISRNGRGAAWISQPTHPRTKRINAHSLQRDGCCQNSKTQPRSGQIVPANQRPLNVACLGPARPTVHSASLQILHRIRQALGAKNISASCHLRCRSQ